MRHYLLCANDRWYAAMVVVILRLLLMPLTWSSWSCIMHGARCFMMVASGHPPAASSQDTVHAVATA